MTKYKPLIWRSLVSSMSFFFYVAVFAFGCFFYFNDPEIAADVKGSPIMLAFILSIPGLIFLFLKMINNFSVRLYSTENQLIFFSLFKRINIPLAAIQKVKVTSPDLIETNFSGPTPKPIRFTRKPIQLFVGAPHILHIEQHNASEPIRLEIGPGWRKDDLETFVREMRKN